MQIPKPSDADKDRFRSLIPDGPGIEVKAMFGNLGAFVNGNMFAGMFGAAVGVKLLDQASFDALAAIDGTGPFGPAERPMAGYLRLPSQWNTDPAQTAQWVEHALEQVGTLPPKTAKPKKPAKSRSQ